MEALTSTGRRIGDLSPTSPLSKVHQLWKEQVYDALANDNGPLIVNKESPQECSQRKSRKLKLSKTLSINVQNPLSRSNGLQAAFGELQAKRIFYVSEVPVWHVSAIGRGVLACVS